MFIPATKISFIFSSTLGYFLTEDLKIIIITKVIIIINNGNVYGAVIIAEPLRNVELQRPLIRLYRKLSSSLYPLSTFKAIRVVRNSNFISVRFKKKLGFGLE